MPCIENNRWSCSLNRTVSVISTLLGLGNFNKKKKERILGLFIKVTYALLLSNDLSSHLIGFF